MSRPPYRSEYPITPTRPDDEDDDDADDDDGDPEDGSTAYPDATATSSAGPRCAPPLHGLVRHFQVN